MKKPTEPTPISKEAEQQAQKDASIEKLKKHGGNIVTAIAVVLAAYFGWEYFQSRGASVDTVASDQFAQIQNLNQQYNIAMQNPEQTDEMKALLAKSEQQMNASIDALVANHGDTIYAWQALSIKARNQMDNEDYAGASQTLKAATEVSAIDAGLKAMTNLRYAQALLADGKIDEAKSIAGAEVPNAFEATKQELMGDIHVAENDTEAAKQTYQNAWDLLADRQEYRAMLALKMESLGMDFEAIEVPQVVSKPVENDVDTAQLVSAQVADEDASKDQQQAETSQ